MALIWCQRTKNVLNFLLKMSVFRDEIASCMEKAYLDISCAHAAKMLSLKEGESDLRIKYLLWACLIFFLSILLFNVNWMP